MGGFLRHGVDETFRGISWKTAFLFQSMQVVSLCWSKNDDTDTEA